MAASMFIQQRFTPTDPRQKAMAYMMPMVMLFIFWSFPAGLVLYWLVYNVLSVLQHYLLHRRREEVKEKAA
jgi:YidC/Oxa1 family membrane protein insertase